MDPRAGVRRRSCETRNIDPLSNPTAGFNDGIFVSAGHPPDEDQNIVQEIVEEYMFYLGSTEVDCGDSHIGRYFKKHEVNNA